MVHAVASMLLDANLPGPQVSHALPPVLGCALPCSHWTHTAFSLADWYWPNAHPVQTVAIVPENVPGEQIVQLPAPSAGPALPAGHALHRVAPVPVWNVPFTHAVHVGWPVRSCL